MEEYRFMIETFNGSFECCNKNGNIYLPLTSMSVSDRMKVEALIAELVSYFPKPKIKEILTVNATVPTDLTIEYMAVNVVDTNNNTFTLYYASIAKIQEQKNVMDMFFALFPNFKNIQVTQMSPAIFIVDGIESKFEDYDELQQDAINAMGIMLTRLINS